jgi:cysteinyl-tRNA synthetase
LERGYTGRQIRGYVLATHYRQPLVFSFISLDAFCRALRRLDEFVRNLNHVTKGPGHDETAILVAEFAAQVRAALHDDLNVSAALAALFHLVRRCNRRLAQGHIGKSDAQTILTALQPLNAILGILPAKQPVSPDNEIEGLVKDRETAREAKDFVTADRLRTALDARGIVLEDTPSGPRWRHRQAISDA